ASDPSTPDSLALRVAVAGRLRALLDRGEPRPPDERATGVDDPPVQAEPPSRVRVDREDARLRGHARSAPSLVLLEAEVDCGLRTSWPVEVEELLRARQGNRLPRRPPEPAGHAEHELAVRLLREHEEAPAERALEERPARGRSRAHPKPQAAERHEEAKELDLARRDVADRLHHARRRGVDNRRVDLVVVPAGQELV